MSTHRINVIAALCAIALCTGTTVVRANDDKNKSQGATASQYSTPSSQSSATAEASNADADQPKLESDATVQSGQRSSSQQSSDSISSSTQPSSDVTIYTASGTSAASDTSSAASTSAVSGTSSHSASVSASSQMMSRQEQGHSASGGEIRRASDEDENRMANEFKGQAIRGSNDEELGKVNDFVVDRQSGKISHVVVSSGGLFGIGDKLRLIEQKSLQPMAASDGFTAQIDKAAFEALPVISEDDLEEGRISPSEDTITAAQTTSPSASAPSEVTTGTQGEHALASTLAGKNVRAGTEEVGSIEGIVVDFEKGEAVALFDASNEFAGSDEKFLVPLNKFQASFTGDDDAVSTTLTRSDFGATAQASVAAVGTTDETLTPTGRTSIGTDADATPSASVFVDTPDREPTDRIGAAETTTSSTSPASSGSGVATIDSTSRVDAQDRESDITASSTSSRASTDASIAASASTTGASSSERSSSDYSSSASKDKKDARMSNDRSASVAGTSGASSSERGSSDYSADSQKEKDASSTSGSASVAGSTGSQRASDAESSSGSSAGYARSSAEKSDQDTDEQLTPTGKTSAEQNAAGGSMSASTSSIRSALDQDEMIAREDVRVTASEGKIVLRGTVSSEEKKSRAEEVAQRAATGVKVDNKIEVKKD